MGKGAVCTTPPRRVNAVRPVTLNMLMLQLGMSTTACTSFAIGESVGGCRSKAETLPPPSATRGGAQCSLPHSHHPPLLRARREIIPSCSGVTGTTEGGGRIEPTARATPPPPVRGERRGYAHRACCSGSAPALSPFRWLDVVLLNPAYSHLEKRWRGAHGGFAASV